MRKILIIFFLCNFIASNIFSTEVKQSFTEVNEKDSFYLLEVSSDEENLQYNNFLYYDLTQMSSVFFTGWNGGQTRIDFYFDGNRPLSFFRNPDNIGFYFIPINDRFEQLFNQSEVLIIRAQSESGQTRTATFDLNKVNEVRNEILRTLHNRG